MKKTKIIKPIKIKISGPRICRLIREEAKLQGITNKALIMQIIKLNLD